MQSASLLQFLLSSGHNAKGLLEKLQGDLATLKGME